MAGTHRHGAALRWKCAIAGMCQFVPRARARPLRPLRMIRSRPLARRGAAEAGERDAAWDRDCDRRAAVALSLRMTAAALESETFAHAIEALLRTAAMVVESRAFAALLGATLRGSADLVASGEPLRATAAEFRAASIMAELGPGRSGPEGHARGRAGVGTPPAHDDLHPAPVLTLTRDAVFDAMRWASHTVVALPTAWGSHTLLQPVSPPNGACLHPGGSPTSLPSSPTPPGCTAGAAAPLPRPSTAWVLHRRLRRMAQKVLRSVEAGAAHPTVATAASQGTWL